MSSHSPQAPTLDNTLGAVFLGVIGASFLYGITTLQVWLYYHRYLRDSVLHKVSVGVLWALDTLHQALLIHTAYFFTIKTPGDPHILWSTKLQVSINVVIILIVQSLYAYRVWILSGIHHGYLGYIVASVVFAGFAVGAVFAYMIYSASTFASLQEVTWAINASLAASTTIDFVITLAMCYYLRKSQGVSVEQRLNSKLTNIMQYTLSSGLLTSAVSLSTLFTYTLMPNNLIFLGLQFLLTKFYVGSFLAMLNARQRPPPNSGTGSALESQVTSGLGSRFQTMSRRSNSHRPFRVQTTIHTHTHTDRSSLHGVSGNKGSREDSKLISPSLTSPSTVSKYPSGSGTYVSYDDRSTATLKRDKDIEDRWRDEIEEEYEIESPASAVVRPGFAYGYSYGSEIGVERHETSYTTPSRERRRPDYAARW